MIRSPNINVTTAQTTVSAASGETIVLGGLITKEQETIHRRVPYLSEIPILGNLFRYDSYVDDPQRAADFPDAARGPQQLRPGTDQAGRGRADELVPGGRPRIARTDGDLRGYGHQLLERLRRSGLPGHQSRRDDSRRFTPQDVPIENLELLPAPSDLDLEETTPGSDEGPRARTTAGIPGAADSADRLQPTRLRTTRDIA